MNSSQQKGPQFVRFFQPVINALVELGGSGRPEEVEDLIAEHLEISDEVRNEQISSGQSRYTNKVNWARFYLVRDRKVAKDAEEFDFSVAGERPATENHRAASRQGFGLPAGRVVF